MRLLISAALAASLLSLAACHSTTVRGTEGRSLTVSTPASMTMHRGETLPLEVGIDREKFTGPVTVTIFQLPKGVASDKSSLKAETTSATFILSATMTADLVTNQAVGVKVEDPNGRQATQYVTLTVTD